MEDMFSRTRMLLGDEALDRLGRARVAVFGIGGVGGHVVEALARSGVGALDLIDSDRVVLSNLNRQIVATRDTLGMLKVEAAKARVLSINPDCEVMTWPIFYLPETADRFDFCQYDYVVDAIDTVAGKLQLIEAAKAAGTPIISCMGAGNKLDPTPRRRGRQLSPAWAPETSWTPRPSGWRTSPRPPYAPWPGSCAGSSKSGASTT